MWSLAKFLTWSGIILVVPPILKRLRERFGHIFTLNTNFSEILEVRALIFGRLIGADK